MSTQHTQPEALRLADAIKLGWLENVDSDEADIDMIQAELRRLHEASAELLYLLSNMPYPEHRTGITHLTDKWHEWDSKRRAAIAMHGGAA